FGKCLRVMNSLALGLITNHLETNGSSRNETGTRFFFSSIIIFIVSRSMFAAVGGSFFVWCLTNSITNFYLVVVIAMISRWSVGDECICYMFGATKLVWWCMVGLYLDLK